AAGGPRDTARPRHDRVRAARRVHRGTAEIPSAAERTLHAEAHTAFAGRLELPARHHRRVARMPAIAPADAARPALAQLEGRGEATRDAAARAEAGRRETEQLRAERAEHGDGGAVNARLARGQRTDE